MRRREPKRTIGLAAVAAVASVAAALLCGCGNGGKPGPPVVSDVDSGFNDGGIRGLDASDTGDASDVGSPDAPVDTPPSGSIYSGVPWLDTDGHLVNAHGVGFIQVGSTFYMVGEQRSGANDTYSGAPINAEDTFTGVNMYSTTDFVSWTYLGNVVPPEPGTILAPPYYGERPKILFVAATQTYVIYIKMLDYTGAPPVYTGYYAALTSSNITGPYTLHGMLNLSGANDFQLFQDTDKTWYFVRDGGALYRLSPDGLTAVAQIAVVQAGEGVSLYKAGSTYFWQSSQGTYWFSNDNSYSTASALGGPWTSHGLFCPGGTKTWQSQDTAVVPITGTAGTTYVYVGDRWVNGDLPASTLVVQPLTVSAIAESIPAYHPVWKLDVVAGTWSDAPPMGSSVNDDLAGTGANQFQYDPSWTSAACTGCQGGDKHVSSTTDGVATFPFTGTQVLLYSAYDASSGIMGVTVEDSAGAAVTPEVHVSLRYDAPPAGNAMVYASPVLASGSYVLKVRVTGAKDLYSSGVACNIDRVLVVP